MSIYITKDGEKRKVNISATDVQLLDIDGRFKNKNLEDALKEVGSGTEENMTRIEEKVEELSNSNLLINGDFQVWTKGTSFSTNSSSTYSADRWRVSGFLSAEKDAKGIKIGMTASDNGEQIVNQYLGNNAYLYGKTLTLSFDVVGSNNITGLSSRINDKDAIVISNQEYTVTTTTTKVIHTFTIPDKLTNELQIDILFSKGQKIPSGQYVYINNVKLEVGSVATQFVPRPYVQELQDCLMYNDDKLTTPYSNPNLLINGDFQVWQRGVDNFNCTNKPTYVADRIVVAGEQNATLVATKADNCLKLIFQDHTKNTSNIRTYFEIDEIKKMVGKTLTFSAEYKSEWSDTDTWDNSSVDIFMSPSNSANKTTLLSAKVITLDDGWKRKILTFKIDSLSDNISSCHIQWFRGTSQDLFGYHLFRNFKLEYGSVATPFIPRPYGEELALCQRYYQRYWRDATYGNSRMLISMCYEAVASGTAKTTFFLPVEMRVAPTVKIVGSPLELRQPSVGGAIGGTTTFVVDSVVRNGFCIKATNTGITSNMLCAIGTWTAGASNYLDVDAEIY